MQDLYFAYGSNMSTARLRARIASARHVGAARLAGHALVCNKRGKDGSGKANLVPHAARDAWGVVFELARADWPALDRFEWGYARSACVVHARDGTALEAHVYLALAPGPGPLAPFDWYRDHCLAGALEHALPQEVVGEIRGWRVVAGDGPA
ncbi:MAG: gamma-glutamylcyclotransferase family protein [Myxococcota bacterium]